VGVLFVVSGVKLLEGDATGLAVRILVGTGNATGDVVVSYEGVSIEVVPNVALGDGSPVDTSSQIGAGVPYCCGGVTGERVGEEIGTKAGK
jgi:hypothetical protein